MSKNQPFDIHGEGQDGAKEGNIKKKNPIVRGIGEFVVKNIVALRTIIVIKSKRNIFKNYSPWTLPRKNFFVMNLFFFAFSPSLVHCEHCPIH